MMPEPERRLTLFLTVIFALVGFLIKGFMYYHALREAEKGSSMPIVVVAILSDRSHLERRKAIRETWLVDKGNVKAYFILAGRTCNIHPRDRLNDFSCEFFRPNITAGRFQLAEHNGCSDRVGDTVRVAVGFSFRLRYPATLTRLGAIKSLKDVKAHLIDAVTKKALSEIALNEHNEIIDGYRYGATELIKLPKGFEGILIVTGKISPHCGATTFQQSDAVEFRRVYYDHVDEHSIPFRPNTPTLSGVTAEIILDVDPELTTLNVLQRKRLWLEYINQLDRKIINEINIHKDIITVDVVESYHNLPRKMSEAFAHLNKQSLNFLVKVDDDVVLDLPRLKHILTTSLISERVIWAKTRRAFPISLYGKWAENIGFPSQVYPDFPCGATYVLSKDLVEFIAKNKATLHHFQGEDVSVGTWLLGLAPQYLGEAFFSCGVHDCRGNVLNRAEIGSPKEMRRIWNVYMQNKTLCYA